MHVIGDRKTKFIRFCVFVKQAQLFLFDENLLSPFFSTLKYLRIKLILRKFLVSAFLCGCWVCEWESKEYFWTCLEFEYFKRGHELHLRSMQFISDEQKIILWNANVHEGFLLKSRGLFLLLIRKKKWFWFNYIQVE